MRIALLKRMLRNREMFFPPKRRVQGATGLTDIKDSELKALVRTYGTPKSLSFSANFYEFECELVRQSTRKERHHDITCFIRKDGKYVVIQKPAYAGTGIYRAPSGGAHRGESIEEGAKREMMEETGLEVRLLRFVLDISLEIRCRDEVIPWRSLVFLAEPVSGVMAAIDTIEIQEVKLMAREEMLGDVQRLMEESGWGGFKYRAFLTRSFFQYADSMRL